MPAGRRRLAPDGRRCARVVAALAVLAGACHDPAGTVRPSPTPSPHPPPPAPGLLHGAYVLIIEAAPECPVSSKTVSLFVQASTDATGRYPGIQAVDGTPVPTLELELLDGGTAVRGGIGTAGGVPSVEGPYVWLELVGTGDVSVGADGTAEVLEGSAAGFLELGAHPNDNGGLGSCKSPSHLWSLRRR